MAIGNVWVFAQGKDGAASSATLELLTKARSLGGNVTAFVAGDASSLAAQLGEYGAQKVYATGDLGGALPGASAAAAMQAVIAGGDSPDLILFPQNYEGRDTMARLSVKLDKTVLTNNVDIAVDGDQVRDWRASISFGKTLWTSPTMPRSATPKIGASRSLLMAMMFLEPFMPTMCCVAPEMPHAM